MQKSPSVVVVLGVHRSGTSLAAHALNVLGVKLGGKLIPGRSDNPLGFWEHSDIIRESKAIERKLGIDPFHGGGLLPSDDGWWNDPAVAPHKASLTELVRREAAAAAPAPFGFKDPRTLILLPLWQQVFAELDLAPRYVLALRHPASVIASMMRRKISAERAEAIWLSHLAAGVLALERAPEAVISYERWFEAPAEQAAELAAALELDDASTDRREGLASLDAAIRSDLQHHLSAQQAAFASDLTMDLYVAARALREDPLAFRRARDLALRAQEVARDIAATGNAEGEARGMSEAEGIERQAIRAESRAKRRRKLAERLPGSYPADAIAPRHADPYGVTFSGIESIKAVAGRTARPLKVCIATEDIMGPIRNGGIGTTYAHLAFLLADAGHEVSIFYPRGEHVENNDMDHWVAWYRARGIRFVPLQLPEDVPGPARRWLRPMIALYEALKAEHFDLVHVSEWRGTAYYCLLAKKQGLAFQNTVFCVKASSPWLWNREYGLAPVSDASDLPKIYAERRSIELADLVIGGSRDLLCWMLDHGYVLPEDRTFVQPNVVFPVEIDQKLQKDRPAVETRMPVEEIVFFGRLEARKGLHIFCDAMHSLHRDGVALPKITFLGKFGSRIPSHPGLTVREYIEAQASKWGVEWQILDNCGQAEALTYLHGRGRLAVMPSVIENSSLTVYETTYFRIPFIATDRGGTPELVAPEHRGEVLVPPHPVPLAEKIADALDRGAFVAAPSFDNDRNLNVWRNFHANMATLLDEHQADERSSVDDADDAPTARLLAHLRRTEPADSAVKLSVCLVLQNNVQSFSPLLGQLNRHDNDILEILIVDDGSAREETQSIISRLIGSHVAQLVEGYIEYNEGGEATKPEPHVDVSRLLRERKWHILKQARFGTPSARNYAASEAKGDYLLFLEPGISLKADAIETLTRAARTSGADVLLSFHEENGEEEQNSGSGSRRRMASIAGDPCYSLVNPQLEPPPLMLARKRAFKQLGGFTTDYQVAGDVAEFLTAATLSGLTVEMVPEVLAERLEPEQSAGSDAVAGHVRAIRPYFAGAPLCLQPLFLATCRSGAGSAAHISADAQQLAVQNQRLRAEVRSLGAQLRKLRSEQNQSLQEKRSSVRREGQRLLKLLKRGS